MSEIHEITVRTVILQNVMFAVLLLENVIRMVLIFSQKIDLLGSYDVFRCVCVCVCSVSECV